MFSCCGFVARLPLTLWHGIRDAIAVFRVEQKSPVMIAGLEFSGDIRVERLRFSGPIQNTSNLNPIPFFLAPRGVTLGVELVGDGLER